MSDGASSSERVTLLTLPRAVWNEFIYAGHFLALGDALTMWALGLVAGIPVSWDFLAIVYLCVFAGNLHDRWADAKNDAAGNPARARVMAKYLRAYWVITVGSLFIVALLLLKFANIRVLLFAGVVFGLAVLYTTVLKPLTKRIVGFKSHAIAVPYALMVPLMASYYGQPVTLPVVLVFAFYYARIFISNAACDIKDTASDQELGLQTLAVRYGHRRAAKIIGVINVVSILPIVLGVAFGVLPLFAIALTPTIAYAFYYLAPRAEMNDEAFIALVVDGEFPLWLPMVLIGKAFL